MPAAKASSRDNDDQRKRKQMNVIERKSEAIEVQECLNWLKCYGDGAENHIVVV